MKLDRYFHCKNCLGKKQPSGIMEAGVKDDTMFVLISGAQIGVIKALAKSNKVINDLLNEIQENQFVNDSKIPIFDDLINLRTVLKTRL